MNSSAPDHEGQSSVAVSGGALSRLRPALLGVGVLALLAGLWGGLVRLGLLVPAGPALAGAHGPLIVSGFLGTVISLERAVALGRPWGYLAPLLGALGAVALAVGLPPPVGAMLLFAESLALLGIFAAILRRSIALYSLTMLLGVLAWLIGNAFWLTGEAIPLVVPWWMGFLVLTVVGERLELSRLRQPSTRAQLIFSLAVAVLAGGLILRQAGFAEDGARLFGGGFVALALWLGRHDVARWTAHQCDLPRFVGVSVLSGYVWLGVGGLLWLAAGPVTGGFGYDAVLHAVFLGFVLMMLFAHAPIIIPAVVGRPIPYRPAFYAHVGLLHLSLLLRIGGDLVGSTPAGQLGGALNVVAVLLFVLNTALAGRPGQGREASRGPTQQRRNSGSGAEDTRPGKHADPPNSLARRMPHRAPEVDDVG